MRKQCLFVAIILLFMLVGCSELDDKANYNSNRLKETNIVESDGQRDLKKEDSNVVSVVSAECTWAFDVTEPTAVMENSDYFLKVRVKTKEKTKYFVKNSFMPSRTYNLEVLDVIVNNNNNEKIPKNIKLAVNGGIVTKQEYVDTMDEETKEKTKVNQMTEEELSQQILINDESYYELEQGKEYYIFVCDITDDENYKGYYGMKEGGYDVFTEDNGMYINVLTNVSLSI